MTTISINPPPRDMRCACCRKHIDELEEFGDTKPAIGIYPQEQLRKAKLVKTFRTMAPLEALENNEWSKKSTEIWEGAGDDESKRYMCEDLIKELEAKHGKDKVAQWMLEDQICNTTEASWECKDCLQLWGEAWFKKRGECTDMTKLTDYPCYAQGWSYPSTHCRPPMGKAEEGHDCPGCDYKKTGMLPNEVNVGRRKEGSKSESH